MLTKFTFLASILFILSTSLNAGCGGPRLYTDRGGDCPHGTPISGPGFTMSSADTVLSIIGSSDTIRFSLYSDPTFCPPMDSVKWYRDGILLFAAPPGAHNYFQYAAAGPGTYTCRFNYWGISTAFSITFSPATIISSLPDEAPFISIYPNPSANGIYTVTTARNEAYTIRILDITGRVVSELTGDQQSIAINLSSCAPGFYSFMYISADGRTRTKKLVYN